MMQIEKYVHITKTPNGALVSFAGQVCLTIVESPDSSVFFWRVSPVFAKLTYGASTFMDVPQSYTAHSSMAEAVADGLTKLDELGAFYGVIDLPEDTHGTVTEGVDADIEEMLIESFVVRKTIKTKHIPSRTMISAFPVLQRASELAKAAGEPMHPKFIKMAHKEFSAIRAEEVEELDESVESDNASRRQRNQRYAEFLSHKTPEKFLRNMDDKTLLHIHALAKSDPHTSTSLKNAVSSRVKALGLTEEVESIDELSKDTLKSYHKKAVGKLVKGDVLVDKYDKREKYAMKAYRKAYDQKNEEFVQYEDAIVDGLASIKEDCRTEALSMSDSLLEAQQLAVELFEDISEEYMLNELSKKTLAAYVKKAIPDGQKKLANYKRSPYGEKGEENLYKSTNRVRGTDAALDRLTKEEVEELDEIWAGPNPDKQPKSYVAKLKAKNTGKQTPATDIKFDDHDKIGTWKRNAGQGEMILRKHKKTGQHEIVANNDQFSHVAYPDSEAAGKKYLNLLGKLQEEVLDESDAPEHMKGKQKPYVSSLGPDHYEVLGNVGQVKATFTRATHGKDAHALAQKHLRAKYNEYMAEEVEEIDELSKATLGSYAKQANDARAHEPDDRKADNRGAGVMKALDKIAGGKNKGGFMKSQAVSARFSNANGLHNADKDRETFNRSVDRRTKNEEVELDEAARFAMDDIAVGGTVIYKTLKGDHKMSKVRNKGNGFALHLQDGSTIQNHAVRSTDASDWNQFKDLKEEVLDEEVTFSGKGSNGVKYEIIKTGDDHAIHANGKHVDTYGSHQRAMSVLKNEVPGLKADLKEEVLDEAINTYHYNATSEPSQFGGFRPKVVHKKKGTTMYLGQHGYKTKAAAAEGARAYLDAYERIGDMAASRAAHAHYANHPESLKEEVLDEATRPLSGDAYWKAKEVESKEEYLKAQRKALGLPEPVKRGRGKPTNIDRDLLKTRAHSNVEAGKRPTAGFDRNEKIHFVRHLKNHPDFAEKHVSQAGRPVGTTKVASQQQALVKKKQDTAFSMWAGLGKK
jgi:hypothetical protein